MSVLVVDRPVGRLVVGAAEEARVLVVREPFATLVAVAKQGPAGPPGIGAATYIHTQASEASVWIVNHNLGRIPQATVLNTANAEVEAQIVHVSTAQLRVYFAVPQLGSVHCL